MAVSWKKDYGILWENGSRMACPICRNANSTYGSSKVSTDGAMILRYRKCKTCGEQWQTVELDADMFIDLLDAEDMNDERGDSLSNGLLALSNIKDALSRAAETLGAAERILKGQDA